MSKTLLKHTIRGMHYQIDGAEESKLIRCTKGIILDVIIDMRKKSPTFGEYLSVNLTDHNYRQLYVPEGFAHGFITLTNNIEVSYLVSEYYTPQKEKGIRWNDPHFKILWPTDNPIVSDKDASYKDYLSK